MKNRTGMSRRSVLTTGMGIAATALLPTASLAANPAARPAGAQSPDVRRRRLGALDVSPLGLGCMGGASAIRARHRGQAKIEELPSR